ncbi:DUF6600 domain-containing protein [Larkinella soli]|uniref:DUF6600 domain-containing protein n=1 Tax=Larkinella soli TaxID=1770527 RepID=UPI000FFCA88D|nr:DUF6600 domain-containing protein [Larkinella soli]
MNTTRKTGFLGLLLFFTLLLALPATLVAQPDDYVSPDTFYDELAPYGRWMDNPEYGRVWVPQVEDDFQPYATSGHWAVTEYGNTWVSDYPWGWAPFHYGRWLFDDYYGWVWVPGTEWGPAWVCWRSGGGYYGWAPLGPGVNINININIPSRHWVFVPQGYFTSPRLYSYCVPRTRVVNVYHQTTIINNVYRYNNRTYFYGPQRNEIERYSRSRVPVYRSEDLRRQERLSYRSNSGGNSRPDGYADRRNGSGRYDGFNSDNRGSYSNERPLPNGNRPGPNSYDADRFNRRNERSYNPNERGGFEPGSPSTNRGNDRFNPGNAPLNRGNESYSPGSGFPGTERRVERENSPFSMPERRSRPEMSPQPEGRPGGRESYQPRMPEQYRERGRPSFEGNRESYQPRMQQERREQSQGRPQIQPRFGGDRQNSGQGGNGRRGPQ